jgi:drug/metabolite transporter (DMT)-like permease
VVLTLQPALSVILGVVLLDESPSSVQLAGVAVILGGVALATAGGSRASPARAQEAAAPGS